MFDDSLFLLCWKKSILLVLPEPFLNDGQTPGNSGALMSWCWPREHRHVVCPGKVKVMGRVSAGLGSCM